jgi:DNA helicase IV
LEYLFLLTFVIVTYLISRNRREKRKYLISFFTDIHPQVLKARRSFDDLINKTNEYFNYYKLVSWQTRTQNIVSEIKSKPHKRLNLKDDIKRDIDKLLYYSNNATDLRKTFNNEFFKKELKSQKSFFDNIEGHSLDYQQRKAVITNEDNNLVIAGAGTGKTTTIVGKASYLISRYKVNPNKILLISFTNKACDSLKFRIQNKINSDISVKTFHKFGLDIISEVKNERPSILDLSTKEILEVFGSFFNSLIENRKYLKVVNHYFFYYLKPYKSDNDFTCEGDRIQYLKDQNLFGYKIVQNEDSTGSIYEYRERLKSQEEVEIANFLFFNGINYIYEERYEYKTASKKFGQYKPDFYLPEYAIYIEHFALDEKGNVPNWFKGDETQTAQEKYCNGIEWKRQLHEEKSTVLIETYSWERKKGILLTRLKEKLIEKNVEFNPKTPEEIWDVINRTDENEVNNFIRLLHTYLTLLKSNNYSLIEIKERIKQSEDDEQIERNLAFLNIFEPVYKKYESFLKERNEIDFSDMINNAVEYVRDKQFNHSYKYIIIDEFQDISIGRYKLIKALLDNNPDCKLFCVGDDWQSIFRFTGSDIALFTRFQKYFDLSPISDFTRASEILYIETTYRFGNSLIKLSSDFILKNPSQVRKQLKSYTQQKSEAFTSYSYNFDNNMISEPLLKAFNEILKRTGFEIPVKVLILGRYNHDIKVLKMIEELSYKFDTNSQQYKIKYSGASNLDITFLTVHSAKGLEADYVILINCNSGKYGFPSEITDDPVLNLLLSETEHFPNSEERRVFYVALTRAKKHLYIISNDQIKSKFLIEIEKPQTKVIKNCKWCSTGILIFKTGEYGDFFGCSNFPYCNYTRELITSDNLDIADDIRKKESYEEAINLYSKLINDDGSSYKAFFGRAECYRNIKKYQDAIKDYQLTIRHYPQHYIAYYCVGWCKYKLTDFNGAIDDWNSAIKINPKFYSVYTPKGLAYEKLGKFNEAIVEFSVSIQKNPSNYFNYHWRARCYIKTENRSGAWDDLQKAKELGSKYADLYLKKFKITERPKERNDIFINEAFDAQYSAINNAINKNLLIKFNYQKSTSFSDGSMSLRTIKPTEIIAIGMHDSLCVKGYCYLREEDRTFSIERISNLIINPKRIEYREN